MVYTETRCNTKSGVTVRAEGPGYTPYLLSSYIPLTMILSENNLLQPNATSINNCTIRTELGIKVALNAHCGNGNNLIIKISNSPNQKLTIKYHLY